MGAILRQTRANPFAPSRPLTYAGPMPDREAAPTAEYRRRADRHRERVAEAARHEEAISRVRLAVALVATPLVGLAFAGRLSPWWLAAPAAAFVALLVLHGRVRRRRRQAERGVAFHTRGLDRVEGRWAGAGRSGARFLDPHHP